MTARDILKWWRAPVWMLALATGAKSFVDNPILGSPALNRRGLHVARLKLAHRMAWARRRRLASRVPALWRESFDRNGFVEARDFLPTDIFARLRDALLQGEFHTREHQQGNAITRRIAVDPAMLGRIPELRQLLAKPSWRGLMAYIGSTLSPPIYYIQTIVMGHADGAPDPQLELHADTFHPSLKAWLFLTDVSDDQGPLTYVPGSHLLTPKRLAWEQQRSVEIGEADRLSQRGSLRITPEELNALDLTQPHRFAVPANTLVAIDTSGFHARGSASRPVVRVELWAYSRRTPFLPWAGLDPLSPEPLALRRAGWLTHIVDRLDGLGVMKQHWLPAGKRRPIDP